MSNMSYCRFQNTLRDLRDCEEELTRLLEPEQPPEYHPTEGFEGRWAPGELQAAAQLVTVCLNIAALVGEQLDGINGDLNVMADDLQGCIQLRVEEYLRSV